MKAKRFLNKVSIMFVMMAVLFVLSACRGEVHTLEPGFPSTEFLSSTDLFRLYVPTGWSTEESVPGAGLVMANTEAAFERYDKGNALESGDVVLNVGFLPLALLQEKELSHLGFQFKAPPDVFLQSLLPMFHVGEKPASDAAGKPALVSLGDEQDAGMLTFSEEGRDGLILVFFADDDVITFLSATTFPGGLGEFQEIIYAVAAGIAYSGSQDALYSKLYGD
jgi:hypothetical protein